MLDFLLHHSPLFYLTQSIWRDEAFSILIAEKSFINIIQLSFEPPLYYALLHFWIRIFGSSEIAARSLSLIGVVLATYIVIVWAKKIYNKHWLSWFLPLTFFLNPMLLYYAFEVRTYGWYIFFATLSLYAYNQKQWRLFTVASIMGFYTHTYMIFLSLAQAVHYVITNRKKMKYKKLSAYIKDPMIRTGSITFFIALPWIVRVVQTLPKLKASWYFPVDLHLIYSVLGNMFVGYEGTPWYGWKYTKILSLVLLGLFYLAYTSKKNKSLSGYFLTVIFFPLILVISISFFKPLFVNRYLIPVSIAEVFIVSLSLFSIKNKVVQRLLATIILIFLVCINIWYPQQHPKVNIRDTVLLINSLASEADLILVKSPLILFETKYYSKNRNKVFLYNPSGSAFPWYIGDAAYSPNDEIKTLPHFPKKAYLISEDGSFTVTYHTAMQLSSKK